MKLPENELRDAIKLLQEGKPLPDEYRFKIFDDDREVELIWNGKTNDVESAVLPFQTIEQVDEPRAESKSDAQIGLDFDTRGRQVGGWTNKLIWGDNKYILSSLKNGPLRQEIEDNGGIKLIYIDPPFDIGADFSMEIEIGGETLVKEPSVLEEIAYRDTWGDGTDSFIAMIYERLRLMYDLLSDEGSIYVHCDYRVDSLIRMVLDEVFGPDKLINEIIWCYRQGGRAIDTYSQKHDTIYWYAKNKPKFYADSVRIPYEGSGGYQTSGKGVLINGKVYKPNELGKIPEDWWDIPALPPMSSERIGYPTQKPEQLIKRIIEGVTNQGDIVSDFFMGSGTTLAVAEKLGRKWIGSDLGKFSIHTTRKRMIDVQRELKSEGRDWRAFEILNLGKYQRQHYVGINQNLDEDEQAVQVAAKDREFVSLILAAYKAEAVEGFETFYGQKAGRLIAVGPIDMQLPREYIDAIVDEAIKKGISRVDVLAFEYEMGLAPQAQEDAREKGVDLALKIIPPDVFDKRAVGKGQTKFYDVAYIELKPHRNKRSVAIELVDFSVFYNQDIDEKELKTGQTKIVVRDGQVLKISKDKNSDIVSQEVLTKEWTDWIDYWSVDFNFESRKEIVRVFKSGVVQQKLTGEIDPTQMSLDNVEEKWTGSYIFENEWQSFRTKKDRDIELKTPFHEYPKSGRYKIAVKVVDIFGNDTTKVIEVNI